MVKIDWYTFIHERAWFGFHDRLYLRYNSGLRSDSLWVFNWKYHAAFGPIPWHRCFRLWE